MGLFCRKAGFYGLMVVFLLSSCEMVESLWSTKKVEPQKKPAKIVKKIPPVKKKILPPPIDPKKQLMEVLLTCKDFVKKNDQIASVKYPDDESIYIEINSNKIFDEITLSKWLSDFMDQIYRQNKCPWLRLSFLASVSDSTYYTGVSRKMDYEIYKRGKISQAEWVKRFEIQKMATEASMKANLKKARSSGDNEVALKLVNDLLDKDADNLSLKVIKANILLGQGADFEAITAYKDILISDAKNPIALFNMAYLKKKVGSYVEAITIYKDLLKVLKTQKGSLSTDDVWLNLADTHLKNNQLPEAADALAQMSQNEGVNGQNLKANLLRAQKKLAEAKAVLQSLIDRGDGSALVLFNMTLINLDLKDGDEAKKSFEALKQKDPAMAKELVFLAPFNKDGKTGKPINSGDVTDVKIKVIKTSPDQPVVEEEEGDQPLF